MDDRDAPRCLTCGDIAPAGVIVALLDGGLARVKIGSATEEIAIDLVDATEGDVVLIHGGVAIGLRP
jgi:hydrogenase maturation factor